MAEKKQTDIQTVAQLAGCSPARVRALIKSGKIPASTKGRQREITIPIENAVRIVKEGQRKYQKKSRIVWYRFSEKMPEIGSKVIMSNGEIIITEKYFTLIPSKLPTITSWAYLMPEMLPMKGNGV